MKKLIGVSLLLALLGASTFNIAREKQGKVVKDEFAPEGMVAYAASYTSDPADEPQYATQKSKTFDYLKLGKTHDYYRGDSVKVGIIDSGINYDHEDFMVNSSTKVKGDSKYYSYQTTKWVYYKASQHGYSYIDDTLGHGTNVAATVAAAVNGIGGTGLAPNVELYVYKVTNSNNGYEFGAIQNALMDAQTLGIDVINMSFQSYEHAVSYGSSSMAASSGCSSILTSYLNDAYNSGITLVGAAGNYNTDEPSYPGSNNHVINVGSLNQTGTDKAGFSNYGNTIDLVAPGYVHVADKGTNTSYKDTSGTSFSAPLVTAAIALYIQKYPSATPSQIESALYAACDPIDDSGSAYTNWAGHGSLNVERFLGCEEHSPTVSSVTVFPSQLNLDLNGTKTGNLSATVNGTNDPSQVVTWSSSNTSVATVSNSGVVTAKATGSTTITATSQLDPTKSGTCSVTVIDSTVHVTGVSLNKNETTIAVGGSETLTATITPSNATNQNVTWTSSNPSVATVSNGTITPVAKGETTITVTTFDGSKTATCTVSVTELKPETLVITMGSFTNASSSYGWYDWTQSTSDSTSISGVGELYRPDADKMQFNKNKNDKQAVVYNTTAIPGSITKIEATSYQTTIRSWTAYVTSTACSHNGATFTFGNNKTNVGTVSPAVGTSTSFGTSNAGYSYFCVQENDSSASFITQFKITYTPKVLSSIAIKTPPTKTNYEAGDTFNPTGLVITKTFADSTTQDLAYSGNESSFTFVPSTSASLTTSDTSIAITVGGKTCSQPITVTAAKTLSSISVSGYTTQFVEGDVFSFGGTVTANYSDSSHQDVTSGATLSGYNMTVPGNYQVTVSFTYKGTTKTQNYNITVAVGVLTSISVSGMTTEYQKNTEFSFDGTCTATFENGYHKTVTPTQISSPDMSKSGEKTVNLSYTYAGVTKSTSYVITVVAYREVIEETTTSIYGTYDFSKISGTSQITNSSTITGCYSSAGGITTASVSSISNIYAKSGYIRLATGGATGSIRFAFGINNITDITIVATGWSSSEQQCTMSITNGGTVRTTSESVDDTFNVKLTSATNDITFSANKNNRICIKSITFYKTTKTSQDIGHSEDCAGLETFIDTYMHMDYVDNLGYCKDSTHHYYSSARDAFNLLNDHQRSLFTSNSAYLVEWTRLSTWASINGEALNGDNELSKSKTGLSPILIEDQGSLLVVVLFTLVSVASISGLLVIKKRKSMM